jgi:hypothetical protein
MADHQISTLSAQSLNPESQQSTLSGGCHCGAVRFQVLLNEHQAPVLYACNCSMCDKLGFLHLIVEQAEFALLQGEEALSEYTFNTRQAKHWFCRHCGVKSFYRPRSHPFSISVNARCLDNAWQEWPIKPFDGQNWEASMSQWQS